MENNSYSRNDLVYICSACKTLHTLEDAQNQALTKGVALAICGEIIFQVIDCLKPECDGKVELRSDTNNPALDVRNLILVPDYKGSVNGEEQAVVLSNREKWHDYLKFQIIPAWDEERINVQEFKDYYNNPDRDEDDIRTQELIYFYTVICPDGDNVFAQKFTKTFDIPLFLTEKDFYKRLNEERALAEIRLRRLVPDTPKFRNLSILLAPLKIIEIIDNYYYVEDHWSIDYLKTWKSLIEKAEGQTFAEAIRNKLVANNIEPPDPSKIENLVGQELSDKAFLYRETLWSNVLTWGFSENLDGFFKKIFRSIFHPITTEFALANNREKLLSWHSEVEKGRALLVDAPMGLGKTYSIVKVLASNPQLSAVIFMPTNKLCQEMTINLKKWITVPDDQGLVKHKEEIKDERGKYVRDDNWRVLDRFKQDFLKKEVYFADGINPQECPKYKDIISLYQMNWIKKRLICGACELFKNCRFLEHDKKAPQSRIIITTHHQYDHFFNNEEFHHWYVNGEKKPRDLFIIDEDIVFSQLYQPTSLDYLQLEAFVEKIDSYLQEEDSTTDLRKSIKFLFSRIGKCGKTSIIRAIDPNFEFPKSLINKWESSLSEQQYITPEFIQWSGIVGNYLKVIEHAVKFGAVVEKWGKGKRFKIHFPNPRSYDLSEAPPHVFFDGTMLNKKFFSKKLSGVEFKIFRIAEKSIWETEIRQNTNSDLPQRWVKRDKSNVQDFLKSIINNLSPEKKIFLITTKTITDEYLKEFIENEFSDRRLVSGYYGNLRGMDDAKDCDVGIMLGSFMPSDAVEIAMALEFIDPANLEKDHTLAENNLWSWRNTNGVRVYKNKFAIIGEMAKAFRRSEHRQALARTRYIFHDTDFYVISKDKVSDYDPFLSKSKYIDEQFRADIFPPRPKRPEAQQKYDDIVKNVLEWLKTHETVTAMEIHKKYDDRRQTVGNKLEEMHENGLLVLEKGTKKKYRLAEKPDDERDSL